MREKLRVGGMLIVDNLLWHGQVLDPADRTVDTAAIREFTRLTTADPVWITTIVPVRDGVMVAVKV
jgi:predicted O-methyltransferase YrrM